MAPEAIRLDSLPANDVPADLRPETYFDFRTHPFAHERYVRDAHSVFAAILGIDKYATGWLETNLRALAATTPPFDPARAPSVHVVGHVRVLADPAAWFEPALIVGAQDRQKARTIYVGPGARVLGSTLYLEDGDLYLGPEATLEPGAGIKGPAIIGKGTEIRQGAYLRGGCIVGDGCTLRGEIKNCLIMDEATFPHPSYLGDSICGYMTHFGNQATTANLGLYAGMVSSKQRKTIVVTCGGKRYDLGKAKMGICMGDFSQVGCNSVSDPGTFLKPYTVVYPLSRIPKGFYGPHEVLKNKPLEHGVIERSPLRPLTE